MSPYVRNRTKIPLARFLSLFLMRSESRVSAMAVSESPARVDKTRDHRYRREDAVRAIEIAIVALEEKKAIPDQLGDLADAIDALKQGQFHAAALLADGALHAKPLKRGKRPETMSLT